MDTDLPRRPRARPRAHRPPRSRPPLDRRRACPSLCEGWSRGHVLTHVARNADGLASLVVRGHRRHRRDDVRQPRRPRRRHRRRGRPPSPPRLVADVEAHRRPSLAGPSPAEPRARPPPAGAHPPGSSSARAKIPFMRLREVVFHHVDLDAGFSFADVEPEVRAFLEEEVRRLREACDPPPGRHPRTPTATSGRSASARHPSRGRRPPCSAGSAAGSPTASTGDPSPDSRRT